jgi:hypothetical protein
MCGRWLFGSNVLYTFAANLLVNEKKNSDDVKNALKERGLSEVLRTPSFEMLKTKVRLQKAAK